MPPGYPFPFRPGGRPLPVSGGQPLALPLVATVAVTNLTPAGASIVGSINPQGLSGSWWFVYGSSPTFGSSTTSTAIAATGIPQTVQVSLSGLTTNTQYWVALVGQTSAGTVTAAPLTFTPSVVQPVPNPAVLPTPFANPAIGTPHYQFPIQFSPSTGVASVQQDTLEEVFACVKTVAVCPIGACPELPEFGIPDPSFSPTPLNPSQLIAAIRRWEPRATETAASQALGDPNAGTWQETLTTGLAGAN